MAFLQPDFGLNGCLFPALPQIQNEEIRQRVFTHRSYYGRPTHVFEDSLDDPSPDNEKFEHLGDSVLGLVVTTLMQEMYPGLRVGPSTKVRAIIVGNANLAEISVKYKLHEKLRLHPAQAIALRASTHVQADVFESFIGGLYTDQGIACVETWLQTLFRPYAKAAYDIVRVQHGQPPIESDPAASLLTPATTPTPIGTDPIAGHLALFNQHLQRVGERVEWVFSDQHPFGMDDGAAAAMATPADAFARGNKATPVWSVQVVVGGEVFGRGRGNTKKAAKNEAAKQGLVHMGVVVWWVLIVLFSAIAHRDTPDSARLGIVSPHLRGME